MQETVYQTILRKQRRVFHHDVGQSLEQLFPDVVSDTPQLLAYHFDEGGDHLKALDYYVRAGDAAFRLFAAYEAINHYNCAFEVIEQNDLAKTIELDELIHLYIRLGRALELDGRYAEAAASYERMALQGEALGSDKLRLESMLALATVYVTPSGNTDKNKAKTYIETALALAVQLGDEIAEARGLWNAMLYYYFHETEIDKSAELGEASLAIPERLDLAEQTAFTVNDLARVYMSKGDLQRFLELSKQAGERWQQLGNLAMRADNYNTIINVLILKGEFDLALTEAAAGIAIADSIGNEWNSRILRASTVSAHFETGDIGSMMTGLDTLTATDRGSGVSSIGRLFGVPNQAIALAYLRLPELIESELLDVINGESETARFGSGAFL